MEKISKALAEVKTAFSTYYRDNSIIRIIIDVSVVIVASYVIVDLVV